ncbi:MAG: SAM-dependent methyltransferase [Ignavibacteriae bacterium]|nr:MAG: SAM-dependent methyltransferase [Ignavibacteriota bacterium]
MEYHIPVLLQESAGYLIGNKSGIYFDGTLGLGGHISKFLSMLNTDAQFIATDKDIEAYNYCEKKFNEDKRLTIFNTSFSNIRTIALVEKIEGFDGIFADLGVSSYQLDKPELGFTFRKEALLDLRMDKTSGKPAYEFVNTAKKEELADVIFQFGEEKKSRVIAKNIVRARTQQPIKTTTGLKSAIEQVIPARNSHKTLARVFQALRIYVNNELDELKDFLKKSVELLNTNGRMVILSYHSLEDRIVKEFFKYEAQDCVCPTEIPVCMCNKKSRLKILTRKPIVASELEVNKNPRARSVRLRVAEKI